MSHMRSSYALAESPTRAEVQATVLMALSDKGQNIMVAKRHDYASDTDIYSNFRFVGQMLDDAVDSGLRGTHLSFVSLIAVKIARLLELLGTGKTPKNEALEDTFVDLANYAHLWGGFVLTERVENASD